MAVTKLLYPIAALRHLYLEDRGDQAEMRGEADG